ncbi:MAG: 2OG-Fe(II) oxygenase [Planctomycetota bacterium]|nr:2OG-Fe(II) oxygenase [Planctomycetota bacterium]
MSPIVSQLWKVLESLGESSRFCAAGSLTPILPGLEVEGIGNVGVPVSANDARRIIEQASQAPFGRGEETIVDTGVRRVWQLEPRQFTLHNAAWEAYMDGIVETVREEFGIAKKVRHELYKLLVYEPGSFFAPHRDTEKTPGMFATLVVCLPSRHEGGTLIVTHDGETKRIDFGGDASEFNIQYAAFYADCQHQITPVTSGQRVCLVYNLAIARQKKQPSAPVNSQAVDAVAELLPQFFADESRDKIVIPFKHQYTEAALDPRELKGADRACMAVLTRAAGQLGYQAFVALLTHFQSGSPDYGTISYSRSRHRYRRFDGGMDDDISGENPDAEFEEVYEEERSLDHWIDPQGRQQPFGSLNIEEDELLSNECETSRSYKQEISEATGNEGATMERWYRQAVVVIWPRDRHFRILAGEGPAHAVPALEELVAAATDPSKDKACRAFATEIIDRWMQPKRRTTWYNSGSGNCATSSRASKPTSISTQMLTLLDKIDAADLSARFVRDILPTVCDGSEGPILSHLGKRFGWQSLAEPLKHFFAQQKPTAASSKLATPVTIFEGLCCRPPDLSDERRAVCISLADELERVIERWDAHDDPYKHRRETRTGIVESVFLAFTALEEIDRLAQLVAYVLGKPNRYDLHTVLIPAVKTIHAVLAPDSPGRNSVDQLLHHCLAELRNLTATPIEPPADWTRDAKIDCKCVDCKELANFLRDPTEQVHRFPRRKELRQHLHRQIDGLRLDVAHVTVRKGSPQTLVCTKTQANYERQLAQFKVDTRLFNELEVLANSEAAPVDAPSGRRRAKAKKTASKDPLAK